MSLPGDILSSVAQYFVLHSNPGQGKLHTLAARQEKYNLKNSMRMGKQTVKAMAKPNPLTVNESTR